MIDISYVCISFFHFWGLTRRCACRVRSLTRGHWLVTGRVRVALVVVKVVSHLTPRDTSRSSLHSGLVLEVELVETVFLQIRQSST